MSNLLPKNSSTTGKGLASKVWLWPPRKMALSSKRKRGRERPVACLKRGPDKANGSEHVEPRNELIGVDEIFVPLSGDQLDEEVVAGIAESMRISGQLHPIAVRRSTKKRRNGKAIATIILVAGAHRLAAAKLLRRKKVSCVYVTGDDTDARLIHLAENLWRKKLTVLRRAENLAEYVRLHSAKVKDSGQVDQKRRGGRPPGGKALAARELSLPGLSAEAIRKSIERAEKIDGIAPDAKKAAIKARLANNQRALERIAEADGRSAQLKMVAQLAKIAKKRGSLLQSAGRADAPADGVSKSTARRSQASRSGVATLSQGVTTCDQMLALWKPEQRSAWAYCPQRERKKVVETLLRAKRKARPDIIQFLAKIFQGREKVSKRALLGIAAEHGLSKNAMNKALPSLGYQAKRRGFGSGSEWFVKNKDRHWKDQLKVFTDAELKAAGDRQHARQSIGATSRRVPTGVDYLSDVG